MKKIKFVLFVLTVFSIAFVLYPQNVFASDVTTTDDVALTALQIKDYIMIGVTWLLSNGILSMITSFVGKKARNQIEKVFNTAVSNNEISQQNANKAITMMNNGIHIIEDKITNFENNAIDKIDKLNNNTTELNEKYNTFLTNMNDIIEDYVDSENEE